MISNKQKIALELLWCQHSKVILECSSKYGVDPGLLVALTGAYSKLSNSGHFLTNTVWHERGWISDDVTPNKARYGYTQVRLSSAISLNKTFNFGFNVDRRLLFNSEKNYLFATVEIATMREIHPVNLLRQWHNADPSQSIVFKFRGTLAYFTQLHPEHRSRSRSE